MKKVHMEIGVDSEVQRTSFQNGTLQSTPGGQTAFTVQTFVEVPSEIAASGANAAAAFVRKTLEAAALAAPGLRFDVQIGPDLDHSTNKRNTPRMP